MRSSVLGVVVVLFAVGCHSSGTPEGGDGSAVDDLSAASRDGAMASTDGSSGDASDASEPSTPSPEWRSGTRLRAKVYHGGAGAAYFSTWHDTTLGFDCEWGTSSTGGIVCQPVSGNEGGIVYKDAACTQPFYFNYACSPSPNGLTSRATACGTPTFYSVGAKITPPPTIYFLEGTTCSASGSLDATQNAYAVTTLAESSLVQGTIKREPRGPTLAADVITTSDGAVDARAVLDVAYDAHCQLGSSGISNPAPMCIPERTAYEYGYYLDAACTEPAAFSPAIFPQPFCSEPLAAISTPSKVWYAIGATLTSEPYEELGSPAQCTLGMVTLQPGQAFIAPGASLGLTPFAALSSTHEGTERIQATASTSPTGDRLAGIGFYDSQQMDACQPLDGSDAQLRCLPNPIQSSYFKDSACTKAVLKTYTTGTPPAVFTVENDPNDCERRFTVYGTGTALPVGTQLYYDDGVGDCTASMLSDSTFYDSTGVMAPSTYGTLTLVQE